MTIKTCDTCGTQIGAGEDRELCLWCSRLNPSKSAKERRRRNKSIRESVLRDLGMVKVRGALGGTYWE